eukprot:920044-Pyramimonas_sp.AAC.1
MSESRSREGRPHKLYWNRALAWDFHCIYSDAAPSTLRNHALAVDLRTIYFAIALSPVTSL